MFERTPVIRVDMYKLLYIGNKKVILQSWHQPCISTSQGKGSGSNWMPQENTAPTDSMEKVGSPDPGMEPFRIAPLLS